MDKIRRLLRAFPETYSEELDIALEREGDEIFKWFLASILFGKRISEELAKNTYREFEKEGLLSPERILASGWDKLVEVLDSGGYARYDFSTATKLLDIMRDLKGKGLMELYKESKNSEDFENKLLEFKGIGNVTANIFLRELRFMPKVNPELSRFVKLSAKNLGIDLNKFDRKTRKFIHLESALLRLGKNYCKKNKCEVCPMGGFCVKD